MVTVVIALVGRPVVILFYIFLRDKTLYSSFCSVWAWQLPILHGNFRHNLLAKVSQTQNMSCLCCFLFRFDWILVGLSITVLGTVWQW